MHQRRNPAAPFHVLDADGDPKDSKTAQDWMAKARGELLEGKGMLVIRHVDVLNAKQVHALASALQEAKTAKRHQHLRVALTLNRKQAAADLTRLLRFFRGTVELPPLRHHIEDLHELVPFFLARLSQQGRLTCSPEAMQLLLRHNWPGNTDQLWQVLKHPDTAGNLRRVGKSYGSGAIKVEPRALERLPIPAHVLAEAGLLEPGGREQLALAF